MPDLVVFPDITGLARRVLLQGLAEHGITGIAVGSQLPSPVPERFIRCYGLPGRENSRRTQWVQVMAQVFDADEVRCAETARMVGAVLRSAPDMVVDGQQPITEPCSLHGPFPIEYPDLPGVACQQVNLTWTAQSSVLSPVN